MRIAEVRSLIEKHGAESLRTIIAEIYKAVPKKLREEKDLDRLVRNPHEWKKERRKRGASRRIPDIDLLQLDVEQFTEFAYQQYYLIPNRFVSKSERAKWRFVVKRLVKELERAAEVQQHAASAAEVEEQAASAAELLAELYKVLCYACGYTLFSTDDPFASVGIEQPEFLRRVLQLKSRTRSPREFVEEGLSLALGHETDPNTLRLHLLEVFLDFLHTAPMKELAIEQCDARLRRLGKGRGSGRRASGRPTSEREISRQFAARPLAELGLLCWVRLHEVDRGIDFFKQHFRDRSAEVELYVLLEHLARLGLGESWVREYERALEAGVRPRQRLDETYERLRRDTAKTPRS